ncbi:hypothetical protein GCM10010123_35080 [Pilimelia anulata]|uniref:Uncharacterized protein n=1 Tax=Pilimelia anulata TaxID=53371 RepID=A0A8J3FAT4_9ACTN|nr:hypothetical protein [Pilimelia anulata]GGK02096.1 hypothetical protein GCM10010123_35080 [Pilimelia anulata]
MPSLATALIRSTRPRPAAVVGWLLRALAVGVAVLVLGRAFWFPYWAAHATPAELSGTLGGPGAISATITHWLLALALCGAAGLLYAAGRLLPR